MEKRGFVLSVLIILIVAFFASNLNSEKTGRLTYTSGTSIGGGTDGTWPPSNNNCKGEEFSCFVKCIGEVETGGKPNGGCGAQGDMDANGNYRSFGKFQIQTGAITDAKKYTPSLNKDPPDGADSYTSEQLFGPNSQTITGMNCGQQNALGEAILKSYLAQYMTSNPTRRNHLFSCRDLALMWNRGPTGYRFDGTSVYWNKVSACMENC